MQPGDKINVTKHYELLNKIFNLHLEGWMKSTYPTHNKNIKGKDYGVWIIQFNKKDPNWLNIKMNNETIIEQYIGHQIGKTKVASDYDFTKVRAVFSYDNNKPRVYTYEGIYIFEDGTQDDRIWKLSNKTL